MIPKLICINSVGVGSAVSFWFEHGLIGTAMLVIGVMLPIIKRKKSPKGAEDWPDPKPAVAATQSDLARASRNQSPGAS